MLKCPFVTNTTTLSKPISSADAASFLAEFKELLTESRDRSQIVYVWRTEKDIPRLHGGSPIVYIGKAKHSLYDRYIRVIGWEAKNYWGRYHYIIKKFGPIWIDIYETDKPEVTENRFLFQYQQLHMERPPINIHAYRMSLPTS